MKKWWKKHKNKVIAVVCIIGSILALSLVLNFTGALDTIKGDVGETMRNESNLLQVKEYGSIEGKHGGVDVSVNKDGSITLDGKSTAATSLLLYTNATGFGSNVFVSLGKADFGDEAEGAALVLYNDNVVAARSLANDDVTFASELGHTYLLKLEIAEGDEFDNVTIYPVLNYGTSAESYFTVIQ